MERATLDGARADLYTALELHGRKSPYICGILDRMMQEKPIEAILVKMDFLQKPHVNGHVHSGIELMAKYLAVRSEAHRYTVAYNAACQKLRSAIFIR